MTLVLSSAPASASVSSPPLSPPRTRELLASSSPPPPPQPHMCMCLCKCASSLCAALSGSRACSLVSFSRTGPLHCPNVVLASSRTSHLRRLAALFSSHIPRSRPISGTVQLIHSHSINSIRFAVMDAFPVNLFYISSFSVVWPEVFYSLHIHIQYIYSTTEYQLLLAVVFLTRVGNFALISDLS